MGSPPLRMHARAALRAAHIALRTSGIERHDLLQQPCAHLRTKLVLDLALEANQRRELIGQLRRSRARRRYRTTSCAGFPGHRGCAIEHIARTWAKFLAPSHPRSW